MNIPVTTILASLLATVFLVLSLRVIRLRMEKKVAHGDGGDEELRRAIRGHANCAEYAPIGILLMLIAELQSVNIILLAILAAAFMLGRLFHAYAFGFTAGNVFLRVRGMQLTFFTIAILAVLNIAILVYAWIGPTRTLRMLISLLPETIPPIRF